MNRQTIAWDADTSDCPGAIGKIENPDTGETILIQTDFDACGVASSFGWSISSVPHKGDIPCNHNLTDGTVDCLGCGLTASEFISAAIDWLNEHDGVIADDPGYFPVSLS
jgi:hypothetical protein